MTSKELTMTEGAMPASFEELSGMAKAFVASGMFKDTTAISQGIVKIQAGKELGIPPVYAMQNINMIKGKLCTSANTMALLIKRSGHYNYRIIEHTDLVCKIMFKELEGGKWVDVGESTFTMEDAKRAKLVYPDSAWIKYPRAMLFSRAISQGARLYTPDAIGGVYTSEEIKAIDGDVEPAPAEKAETVTEETTDPEPIAEPTPEQIAQAEKDKNLWPPDPKHAAEAASHSKLQPTTKETAEAAAFITHTKDITMIAQAESFPPNPSLGMKVQVKETGEVYEWVQVGEKGGRWHNLGVNPQSARQHESDEAAPTTLAEFFAWLQGKDKKFGPTWFYKTFSYTKETMQEAKTIGEAYREVKEIQSW